MRRFLLFSCLLLAALVAFWGWRSYRVGVLLPPRHLARPFERPTGMAPVAWRAFRGACFAAGISPIRIGQTLGNNPRSKGYHLRDGTVGGEDYSAAVDLGVDDLTPRKRAEFLEDLAHAGFIAWFRTGPHWKGAEHVHAVYAGLPMKPQLRAQVRLWNRQRRATGCQPLRWQRLWRRFWT